jgi:hypothetical protein
MIKKEWNWDKDNRVCHAHRAGDLRDVAGVGELPQRLEGDARQEFEQGAWSQAHTDCKKISSRLYKHLTFF